ncbi:hypothetical protein RUM43_013673 [Polyplax serrata]|uniref:AB hydrolase-1 domain-containing protein n=1 Tax=Polyplax serrata TaxID=468196 RepID=A0AAN8P5J0_POLSC
MFLSRVVVPANKLYLKNRLVRYINTTLSESQTEEVKIPLPYGHISGKWWGSKNQRPILCLHGWLDNANSFDTLIPLLPPEYSYLAVDLPGHGYSSHFPRGLFYRINDVVAVIRRIQQYYNWPKISLLSHSFGASISFLYASYFPKEVDFFVGLDMLKPLSWNPEKHFKQSSQKINQMIKYDLLNPEASPAYDKAQFLERNVKNSNGSLTLESAEILFSRATKDVGGLYTLRRDIKVKTFLYPVLTQKQHMELAGMISCNVLFLKADKSPFYDVQSNVEDVIYLIKKNGKLVEYHILPGTHHFHLNTPEVPAPVISSFIKKVDMQKL